MIDKNIQFRNFRREDSDELWNLFFNTVHNVNIKHYSKEQVNVWAPQNHCRTRWHCTMVVLQPNLALYNDKIVGYANLGIDGLIDHFFIHHEYQRQGVGGQLIQFLTNQAKNIKNKQEQHPLYEIFEPSISYKNHETNANNNDSDVNNEATKRIYANVSITARPFFERYGFETIKKQNNVVANETIVNYLMEKWVV